MKWKWSPLFVLIVMSSLCRGQTDDQVNIHYQIGADFRLENTVNPEIKKISPSYGLGFLFTYKNWGWLEEILYSSDESSTGNVKISYQTIEWNQWLQYRGGHRRSFQPFAGLGLGLSQDKISTSLSPVRRVDKSRFFLNPAASLGIVYAFHPHWETAVELRVWKFEQKKDPNYSGLFSLRYQ